MIPKIHSLTYLVDPAYHILGHLGCSTTYSLLFLSLRGTKTEQVCIVYMRRNRKKKERMDFNPTRKSNAYKLASSHTGEHPIPAPPDYAHAPNRTAAVTARRRMRRPPGLVPASVHPPAFDSPRSSPAARCETSEAESRARLAVRCAN